MIEIAIVEDEKSYRNILCEYLKRYGEETGEEIHISVFTDGDEVAENYTAKYDIILMDIEMQFMNGMDAAEMIRTKDEQVIIIFITNMAQYALRGYKVNALDYVLKPISYVSFAETLKKAVRSISRSREKYLTINMRDTVKKLRISEIEWIESMGHRLTFHSLEGDYETTVYSMKEMQEKLEPENFTRCNSGCLVNLKWVKDVENNIVNVNGKYLTVSRGRKNDFMAKFVNYMTE